jgi:Na+-transporting NADH:ubiquinone oxidoreductase subunit NqrD
MTISVLPDYMMRTGLFLLAVAIAVFAGMLVVNCSVIPRKLTRVRTTRPA